MTCHCGLHKTKQVPYSSYDFGPRSNLATSLFCTQESHQVLKTSKLHACFLKITYQSRISKSSNSLGNLFNHFDIFLRDSINRYCFPQSLTTNYNYRFVQESVSDYNCLYYSSSVGNSLRYRMDPAHQSFCYTKLLMALQFTVFFCQMDDHIGVTVPSNSCKSAIDCTRFSGCCLTRACLHKEYANSCLLLKDSLRWNVKNHILLCLMCSRLL